MDSLPRCLVASLTRGVLFVAALAVGGCPPPARREPFEPIPLRDAARIVNENTAKITETLKATGSVDGYFTLSNGRRRSYHVDATLFYLAPSYVRFDLKKFGDRQALFGSNETDYWFYTKEDDSYYCGRHDETEDLPPEIPIRPDHIADALGLTPIAGNAADPRSANNALLVQRVVDEHQQLLFVVHDEVGSAVLEKEYWLDRYRPQLVRRVIFRNVDGVVEMESHLDDYKPIAPAGPLLPGIMSADWPGSKAHLRFRIRSWTLVGRVKPDSIQFAAPRDCVEQH